MTVSTLEVFTRNPNGTTGVTVSDYDDTRDAFRDGYTATLDPDVSQVRVRTGNVFTDLIETN